MRWTGKQFDGGDSATSVVGGKLFGMSNRGDGESGSAVQQRVPQSKEGPDGTPAVDGDKV